MSFVQIISFQSDRIDEIQQLRNQWLDESQGQRSAKNSRLLQNRDAGNSYSVIVEFPSYDEAMANSGLPATQAFAEKMSKLCTGAPEFMNLEVLEEESFLP